MCKLSGQDNRRLIINIGHFTAKRTDKPVN